MRFIFKAFFSLLFVFVSLESCKTRKKKFDERRKKTRKPTFK